MSKILNFYGRFLIPFSQLGYRLKGLPSRPSFPALKGKHILITGATDGIGAAMARLACESGANVHAVGRSQDKLDALVRSAGGDGRITPLRTDLSSAGETLSLVDALGAAGVRLDGLVNNVGILNHEYATSPDGVDLMYAVNILNPYIMTETLLDRGLLADEAVIANMASGGLYNAPQNLAYLEQDKDGFNGFAAYATHKRAQIVLSDAWTAERQGLRAYTMHPGWVDTPGVRSSLPKFYSVLGWLLRQPEHGADTALWLIANRPKPVEGALWFDRKARSAHAFKSTRTPLAAAEDIRAKLARDAGRLTDDTTRTEPAPAPGE